MIRPAAVGLYVHIPFCAVKCFYCDFTAFAGQRKSADRYLEALEAEAHLMPAREPSTLYIGGGTPSELDADQLAGLLALISRSYPSAVFKEATCEANVDSLSVGKIEALRRGGINRLSLGLQTADDALLRSVGRRHTMADFARVYRDVRAVGGFSVSIDLMYGLPGQTLQSCLESLEEVLRLAPEHLSLYGLQVEDRTLFSKRGVETDEGLGREMFERCLDRLAAEGFHHYEISNFARPGFESIHNGIYWHDGEYVGLGCGAASYLGGARTSNIDRLEPYCSAALSGRRPIAQSERLAGQEKLGETIMLKLRLLDGFEPTEEMNARFSPGWRRLAEQGLVSRRGPRVALTREGVFLANAAAREFVAPFREAA